MVEAMTNLCVILKIQVIQWWREFIGDGKDKRSHLQLFHNLVNYIKDTHQHSYADELDI